MIGHIGFTIAYTDSAVQTDWSGGSGVWYPVFKWGKQFLSDLNIQWRSQRGTIVLQYPIEFIIDDEFIHATSVYSDDMDNDGDMDIIGSAYTYGNISYWENTDGFGTSWAEHVIAENAGSTRCVITEDLDGDGDFTEAQSFVVIE